LQILQRRKDANEDQRVKTPFYNAVMEEEQFEEDDEIHCLEDKGSASFLTSGAYEKSLFNDQINQEWDGEAILQIEDQHRYNPRSKMINAKGTPIQRAIVLAVQQDNKQRRLAVAPIILKTPSHEIRGLDKSPSHFIFQSEIQKLRIPIPLIELVKNESFNKSILEALEPNAIQASTDYVNLQDDKQVIVLSPMIKNYEDNSPSFYVSLTIHDKIFHNCLLETRANHNLMPKAAMDKLGLDITKPYYDLFYFDSRKVECLGLIKDLAITLSQLSMKSMMMDIVVVDVAPQVWYVAF